MLKNNKGVTLMALSITIIVILILASVTITTSTDVIRNTKTKKIISNMYLVKAKAEVIYEEYSFNDDINVLKGDKEEDLREYGITVESDDLWYVWNEDILKEVNLSDEILSGDAEFIINYSDGEVIYSKGIVTEDGETKYKLSEIVK